MSDRITGVMMADHHRLIASTDIGDGVIDNIIIDRSAHLYVGAIVLVTMTVALVTAGRDALAARPLTGLARWSIGAAQLALVAQVLLGIKLLDQGQGIFQLYIHYVGGLIPLGAFLLAGWFDRVDETRRTRITAALVAVGYVSALMAFFIGRAYANRG